MKYTNLIKTLYAFLSDLEVFTEVFIRHNDANNIKETKRLILVVNEFLDTYLLLEEEKKEEFFVLVNSWIKITMIELNLLNTLYLSYLNKELALSLENN